MLIETKNHIKTLDIRDLIQLEDVMEQMNFGPNGGLVFCMEFLVDNLSWLEDELGDYDDDYLIFDCPGIPFLLLYRRREQAAPSFCERMIV